MKIRTLADVRNHFSKVIDHLGDEPLFVTRNGRITAVLEHIDEADIEDYLLERSRKFRTMLRRVARDRRGVVTLDEYRKRAKA
jgi:PHD/YefM family antitoxin component YafN of YafNO toxin-antitoxin module